MRMLTLSAQEHITANTTDIITTAATAHQIKSNELTAFLTALAGIFHVTAGQADENRVHWENGGPLRRTTGRASGVAKSQSCEGCSVTGTRTLTSRKRAAGGQIVSAASATERDGSTLSRTSRAVPVSSARELALSG